VNGTLNASNKQDTLTPLGGSGNNLLNNLVPSGKLANIFGGSPISVSAIFDPGQPDHGNLKIEWNVLWDAGELINQNTGTANSSYTTNSSRYITTHAVSFNTTFTAAPYVFPTMLGNATAHASIDRIWVTNVSTSGCDIVVADRSNSNSVTLQWLAIQANTMQ
jgi:hypothetical protein